jgi:hypothetical protein
VARDWSRPNDAPADVSLAPFYRTHGRTYSVYFDVLTAAERTARLSSRAADAERERRLEAATVTFVQPGNAADEQRFNYHGDPSSRPVTRTSDRTGRGGVGWFSFDLPLESAADLSLVVTYHNDLGLPVLADFDIQVDGSPLAHYTPNRAATGFWNETYALPAALVTGKNKITVRFQATADARIATVYGLRIIRTKDAQG